MGSEKAGTDTVACGVEGVFGHGMDFDKVPDRLAFYVLFLGCWFAPGLWIVERWSPGAWQHMDLPRLALFAFAATAPTAWAWTLVIKLFDKKNANFHHCAAAGVIANGPTLFAACWLNSVGMSPGFALACGAASGLGFLVCFKALKA